MSVLRVAILDDYQQAALKFADWSPIAQRVSIDVFSDTIADEDLLVKRLAEYDIICAMRERTKFSCIFNGSVAQAPTDRHDWCHKPCD